MALDYVLTLEKVHCVTEFNQKSWLNPCMNMNTKLKIKANNIFRKGFLQFSEQSSV